MSEPAVVKKRMPRRRLRKWVHRGWSFFLSSLLVTVVFGGPISFGWPLEGSISQFINQPSERLAISRREGFAIAAPPVTETSPIETSLSDVTNLSSIAAGIAAFEQGQPTQAIAHWQTALTQLNTAIADQALIRAYVFSNLATAYRQIGELDQAQQSLSEGLSIIESWEEVSPTYWEVSARLLNTQGQSQWQQGQTQAALTTWQQSEAHYGEAISDEALSDEAIAPSEEPTQQTLRQSAQLGKILTQVNQAIAYQELGFNAQAVAQLEQLSSQLVTLPASIQLTVAKELGQALRSVGELHAAQELLSKALRLETSGVDLGPEPGQTSAQHASLALELGHTLRLLSHRAIAVGQASAASDYVQQAIDYYQQASAQQSPLHSAQAQLNQLSYLIEMGQLESADTFSSQINLQGLPPGREQVEAYISYAHSLNCLQAPATAACTKKEWQESQSDSTRAAPLTPSANDLLIETLTTGLQQAKSLRDPRLETYALGELGHAYELRSQTADAVRLTQQALSLLEGQELPEVAYLWEWQLARLYQKSDQNQAAMVAYQQALKSLADVRQNLLLVDPQVQFSFRDNVEPVYREFISLLITSRQPENQPDQQALQLAVQTMDALQLTELENFLGCNLSQLVSLSAATSDPTAVKLYPIILPEQLAIIVDVPNQPLTVRSVPVSQQTVESTLTALRYNLTLPGKTPAVLAAAQDLYGWLIEPIQPILTANPQLKTLVFVPDGPLRNIPMGVLYDGEQYLVEKEYAIAIAPQLDLFAPRPTPARLKVLTGGIGLPQTVRGQAFPPIELIQAELDQIPTEFTVAQPLINEAFTQSNIEQQLANETYSAIHWKTHGVFSSSPGETFLVAYQEGISANELSSLVQSATQQQAEPLELLVLSACATAQGDRRAVLGLAGIAVRAGTRSTLSTLWRADDGANTALMGSFYQGLDSGLTKAQSLQKAQKMLLSESGYPAPYYWAPYVLVGNWL